MPAWQIVLIVLGVLITILIGAAVNWVPRPAWFKTRYLLTTIALLAVASIAIALIQARAEHDKDRATADPAPPTTTAPTLGSPPASTTTTSPTTTTSSTKSGAAVASASKQFLADMTASEETPSTGAASVNGQTYPHSIYGRIGGCTTDVSYSYVLGRQWSQFTATVGLRDGSDFRSVVQFEVYADNDLVYSSDNVAVGQSPVATVPVKDVLNIKIRYLFVQGNKGLCSNAGYAVWGNAAVSK
ncbi:NPCBM/NEW2 domain-containing protein [Nocardia aobensis]|uniref:NPCBM/NEW2 domain-containing protein n=1 Tax=Nocardia aobensis TaxID=257277 RepID=A0ABW6NW88_9NOCA